MTRNKTPRNNKPLALWSRKDHRAIHVFTFNQMGIAMTDKEAIEAVRNWLDNPNHTQAELHVLCAQIKQTNPKAYAIMLQAVREIKR